MKSDTNANGLYRKCKKITKAQLQAGDFVFKLTGCKATHIGYVVDKNLNVIEARGRDYGVVKRTLSKGPWNAYGRPPFWAGDEIAEVERDETEEVTTGYIFKRNLKYGCRGEDVVELKKLLEAKGYGGFEFGNKNFLSLTKRRVKDIIFREKPLEATILPFSPIISAVAPRHSTDELSLGQADSGFDIQQT